MIVIIISGITAAVVVVIAVFYPAYLPTVPFISSSQKENRLLSHENKRKTANKSLPTLPGKEIVHPLTQKEGQLGNKALSRLAAESQIKIQKSRPVTHVRAVHQKAFEPRYLFEKTPHTNKLKYEFQLNTMNDTFMHSPDFPSVPFHVLGAFGLGAFFILAVVLLLFNVFKIYHERSENADKLRWVSSRQRAARLCRKAQTTSVKAPMWEEIEILNGKPMWNEKQFWNEKFKRDYERICESVKNKGSFVEPKEKKTKLKGKVHRVTWVKKQRDVHVIENNFPFCIK